MVERRIVKGIVKPEGRQRGSADRVWQAASRCVEPGRARAIVIVALAVLATLGQLAFLYMVEYRIGVGVLQGRYLLPMFVPQMAGCVVGLRAVGRRLGARLDAGWTLALLLIAAEVASVVRALERYHGPTPLGRARAWALEYGGDFFPPALALATAACLAALLVAARGLAHGGPAEDERV